MPGTTKGGIKVRDKMLAEDPNYYKRIGAIGGTMDRGYSFAHGKVNPSWAGKRGGKISRRNGPPVYLVENSLWDRVKSWF